jgi:hypothetical protein
MSGPLICSGCGQPIEVPPGYRRNKIQCPCGVISELPESARREADERPPAAQEPRRRRKREPSAETERWAADLLGASDAITTSPASPSPEEPAEVRLPSARKEAPRERDERVPCRRCGQLVRRQRECPTCDAEEGALPSLSLDDAAADEEFDGKPYVLDGGNDVLCPSCTNALPPGSTFCTRCGLDFVHGKKKPRTYEPLARRWETTLPAQSRFLLWGLFQTANFLVGMGVHSLVGGSLTPYLVASLGFAAMTMFLMGTYDELHMERDTRGRVKLTKTWRVCFFVASVHTTEVRGFSGVLTTCCSEVSAWEWIVFGCLILSGILPGLIWWFCVIYKTTYQAALTRDHGYVDVILFQGWSREQMVDIARTVADATALRCEGV